jgi:hypothetical protein
MDLDPNNKHSSIEFIEDLICDQSKKRKLDHLRRNSPVEPEEELSSSPTEKKWTKLTDFILNSDKKIFRNVMQHLRKAKSTTFRKMDDKRF